MVRSLLFNVLFFVTTTLFVVLGSPLLFAPAKLGDGCARAFMRASSSFCCKLIVGTEMEVRGRTSCRKVPCLVAAKHQSAWETFALIPLFRDPAF